MKRIVIGLLIGLTTLSIIGCGQDDKNKQKTSTKVNTESNIKNQETEKDYFVLNSGNYVVGNDGFKQGIYEFEATNQAGLLNVYRDGENIYCYGLGTKDGIEVLRKAGVDNIDKFGSKVKIALADGDIIEVPKTLTVKATPTVKVIENK